MTRRGVGLVCLFALLLLLALATGLSEIFVMVFMTGFLLAFALVSTMAGVFVLKARHSLSSSSAIRGSSVKVEIAFDGFQWLPIIVRVTLRLPENKQRNCAGLLLGNHHVITYDNLPCPHRGLWQVGINAISIGDIFGFFLLSLPKTNLPVSSSLIVYPVLQEISGFPPLPMPNMEYSEKNPVIADQGDSFSDTRLYRDGDPLKRIHWKMTVRTRELHTRQYEMSIDQMVVILLDTSMHPNASAEAGLGYADMATECAAALALFYISGGHAVRVCPAGAQNDGLLIRTREEFTSAYTLLASADFRTSIPVVDAVTSFMTDLPCISSFHVITHEPSEELMEIMSHIASLQRNASIIYPGDSASCTENEMTHKGLRLIGIAHPRDISQRLGGSI